MVGGYISYFKNFANQFIDNPEFEKIGHLKLILQNKPKFYEELDNNPLKDFLNQDFSDPRFDQLEADKEKTWL